MIIKWLGHSCFLITSNDGIKIITDPYTVGGGINYAPINETADIVLVSHDHGDHSNVSAISGKPEVVKGSGVKTVSGIQIRGVATHHDTSQGKLRGANTVFALTLEDINLCHLGDLGHVLSPEQINEIGGIDILLIPVGGFFTIDAAVANQVCNQLSPRVIIPMHFKTPSCDYPIASVDDFLKGKNDVITMDSSEVKFELKELPATAEIIVLRPAL